MTKKDQCINKLCKELGKDYCIRVIDLEKVIYRDFYNGFNVEISGMHTTSLNKKANIYLWFGDKMSSCLIVKTLIGISRDQIKDKVDELYQLSNDLIEKGLTSREKLIRYIHG